MALAIFPLRVHFSMPDHVRPGHYLGSAWRGGFGYALKKLVCLFNPGHCENCPVRKNCVYTTVFESKWAFDAEAARGGVPAPYTLYPVQEDGKMWLYMTIFGSRTMGYLPFILHALRLAGENRVAQIPFAFIANESFNGQQWEPLQTSARPLQNIPEGKHETVTLNMLTPARFKHHSHFVTPETLNYEIWATAMRRRLVSLASFWGHKPSMQKLCEISTEGEWQATQCRWQEMERHSSRQKTTMKIGGVVGNFTLNKEQVQEVWPLLWLGQWVHVGKLATMGLGRYELSIANQGGAE